MGSSRSWGPGWLSLSNCGQVPILRQLCPLHPVAPPSPRCGWPGAGRGGEDEARGGRVCAAGFPGHPRRELCLEQAIFLFLMDTRLVGITCKVEVRSNSQRGTSIGHHSHCHAPIHSWEPQLNAAMGSGVGPLTKHTTSPGHSVITDRSTWCKS